MVSGRRRRNPYQITREIHHNLGIETRKVDGQSRRANRAAGETRSQSQKSASRAFLVKPEKRRKSEPLGLPCLLGKMSDRNLSRKTGALSSPRQLCLFLYLISSARLQNHSETKLVYRDFFSACDGLVTDIPHSRN